MIIIEKVEMIPSSQTVNVSTQFKIMVTVSEGSWSSVKNDFDTWNTIKTGLNNWQDLRDSKYK